jgi:transposase-like protein
MAPRHKITDQLTKSRQEQLIADILGGRPFTQIARELGIADTSVARWWKTVPEEDKRRIAAKLRITAIESDTATINQDRLDIATTYESLARRVEKLITRAEENEDDAFALSAMEGLRKVLRDIATMQGKLAQNLTVEVKLAESGEWIAMRQILEDLCEEVPEAREPLLRHMRRRRLSITQEGRDAF